MMIFERNDYDSLLSILLAMKMCIRDSYIPFWSAPFLRVVHWDYLRFPETWMPPRTEQLTDYLVYWIDPARKAALDQAMKADRALPPDASIDKDPYQLRAKAAAR